MSLTFVSYNYHSDLSPTWIADDMHKDKKSLPLLLEMFSNKKKSSNSFFVLFFKFFTTLYVYQVEVTAPILWISNNYQTEKGKSAPVL